VDAWIFGWFTKQFLIMKVGIIAYLISKRDKQKIFGLNKDKYEQYNILSQDFKNPRTLLKHQTKSISLKKFCDRLEKFEN